MAKKIATKATKKTNPVSAFGREWKTETAFAEEYGVNLTTLRTRVYKKGMSYEEAVAKPVKNYSEVTGNVVRAFGKTWKNQMAFAREFGINYDTLRRRINEGGMTYEEAVAKPVCKRMKFTDHCGQTFDSVAEAARYHGVSYSRLAGALKDGLNVEEAFKKAGETKPPVKDHLGRCYTSKVVMCNVYNISTRLFNRREKLGWDLERILTTPDHVTDHLGHAYATIGRMCEHWGVSQVTYTCRLKRGWSQERALTTPSPKNTEGVIRAAAVDAMISAQIQGNVSYIGMIKALMSKFSFDEREARDRINSFNLADASKVYELPEEELEKSKKSA